MRSPWVPVIALSAVAISGCGTSESSHVRSKVEQFVSAASKRDYRTICDQVLAPSLLAKLAESGIPCEQAMRLGFSRVQRPTLSIGRVSVSGSNASVITLTGAHNQLSSLQSILLVKTSAGWRISSLGSPLARPSK